MKVEISPSQASMICTAVASLQGRYREIAEGLESFGTSEPSVTLARQFRLQESEASALYDLLLMAGGDE